MPFDGEISDYAKPDVFSVEGLLAWLDTQDPATEYDYFDTDDCLLCRYGRARGLKVKWAGGNSIRIGRIRHEVFPENTFIACADPWTYGAAAQRCRDYLARVK